MCGIVGLAAFDQPLPYQALWPQLIDQLSHRGPDGSGSWMQAPFWFGHRRLSIIDLQQGAQPMVTGDGHLAVTFNGEIYNYLELRAELEKKGFHFETSSDTEVLLHGYSAWGERLPEKLTGMFAFAIADRAKNELFVARDRFGEKPLFVWERSGVVVFASELRCFTALPDHPRTVDLKALSAYLSLNYVPGEATLMKDVRRIAPGTWKIYGKNGVRAAGYWDFSSDPKIAEDDAAKATFQQNFDHAVRLCLRSDVPVAVNLSGGIDSSLVAESAMRQGRLERAFCLDFDDARFSEWPAASEVARQLKIPLERVLFRPEPARTFMDMVAHADDPLADSSTMAVWCLAREVAKHYKVVLGGDGGDEVFGGYLTYQASLLHQKFKAIPLALRHGAARLGRALRPTEGKVTLSYKAQRFLRAFDLPSEQAHFSWNGSWLPHDVGRFLSGSDRSLQDLAAHHHLHSPFTLRDLQRVDLREYLPNDILVKVDRMAMAHGLEVRSPFLNHDLVQWALRLKPADTRVPKGFLRAIAQEKFGAAIARRPKQGFSIPIHQWVRGPLRELFEDLFSAPSLAQLPFLDAGLLAKEWRDHRDGKRSLGYELWGLAVFVAWWRLRISGQPTKAA